MENTSSLPFYKTKIFCICLVGVNIILGLIIFISRIENVKNIYDVLTVISASFGSTFLWLAFKQVFPTIPVLLFHGLQILLLTFGLIRKKGYILTLSIFFTVTFLGQLVTILALGLS